MQSKNKFSAVWNGSFVFFLLLLTIIAALFYYGQCYRAGINYCMSPNEGWNAFFAKAAMDGEALYPSPEKLLTNNYPPLSFYATGILGMCLGDQIMAGRILSLLASIVIACGIAAIISRLGGDLFGSIAGGALFLAMLCRYYDYVGQNDPQLLAQAIMTMGTLWFLDRELSGRGLVLPLLTMVAAGFFKHNIIALPAASLALVLLLDWHRFLRLAAISLLFIIVGLLACLAVYGPSFIYNFCTPRGFSWGDGIDALPDLLHHIALPVAAFVAIGVYKRRETSIQFVNLLLGISFIAFFLQSCGDGVGPNAEFDMVIAASVGFGLTLSFLGRSDLPECLPPGLSRSLLVAAACLTLWPSRSDLALRLLIDPRTVHEQRQRTEIDMENAVARCRSMPGDVYCDPTVLYRAGKQFRVDSYNVAERIRYGRLHADAIDALYRKGSLSFVENPYNFLDDSWYPY